MSASAPSRPMMRGALLTVDDVTSGRAEAPEPGCRADANPASFGITALLIAVNTPCFAVLCVVHVHLGNQFDTASGYPWSLYSERDRLVVVCSWHRDDSGNRKVKLHCTILVWAHPSIRILPRPRPRNSQLLNHTSEMICKKQLTFRSKAAMPIAAELQTESTYLSNNSFGARNHPPSIL
jgi:hypothetical protein